MRETYRTWTEEENRYLERYYPIHSAKRIAKNLGRSETSVRRKAANMKLNRNDFYSANLIAESFRTRSSVVIRWVENQGLPARKILYESKTYYLIEPTKFWKWVEVNKDKVNLSKYQLGSILPEPEWIGYEKRNYKYPNRYTVISEQEKNYIRYLLKSGKSYREIAEMIGRSNGSVENICRTIFM